MPSNTVSGVPAPWQLTTRMPWLRSEYSMLSTASPAEKSPGLPMLSAAAGNVPGAGSQRTRPVTTYVPAELPPAVTIVQVPPPVTASDVFPRPAGATEVAVPVNAIVAPVLGRAYAWPPGFTVGP